MSMMLFFVCTISECLKHLFLYLTKIKTIFDNHE